MSGIMVAGAPNAAVLMTGRALLGVSIGGFWSISAAIMMRLVPEESVPKALAILNGGNAVASTLAAPIGSFLGSLIGWRGAFFIVVPLAAIAFVWQWRSLPSLPPTKDALREKDAFTLFRHRQFALGMSGVGLFFLGQFALFTYLRPFLDTVTHGDAALLSGILLATGAAGAVGTFFIGNVLNRSLYGILFVFPIAMSAVAILMISIGSSAMLASLLLVIWGLLGTSAPVAWWTWLSRTMPHEAEAGGGMMVAVIQLAITLGAVFGGILFDAWGFESTFDFSFQPSLDRNRILALAGLDFINRAEVVHLLGPPGTGKSHIATALAVEAVKAGKSVYFIPLADLIAALAKAEREGTLRERIRFLCRSSLLVVDEIGYLPVTPGGGNLFFQLVNARYEKGAMILTSNRGFAEWGEVFGDPVVATALLDRLLHHAVVVQIEGSSYRMRQHADLLPEHARTFSPNEEGRPCLDYDRAIVRQFGGKPPSRRSIIGWLLFQRLARRRPTRFLRGGVSDLLSPEIAAKMCRMAPQMGFAEVPGVGHAPLLDEPEALEIIQDFLGRFAPSVDEGS